MKTEEMIFELRRLEEAHKDDFVGTGAPNWSLMCRDVANRLEELLAAQEPRVMTLEEVAEWHKKLALEREPIYVEYRPNSGLGISQWTIDYFGFNPNCYPNKDSGYYGKWLRCWTSRPDEKRRAETPWGQ